MTQSTEPAHASASQTSWLARTFNLDSVAWGVGPVILALVLTTLALIAVGADPLQAYRVMWNGAFGNVVKFGDVILALVPLLLASVGLLITFTAGLWNIGIEGQIVMGAIFTAWT